MYTQYTINSLIIVLLKAVIKIYNVYCNSYLRGSYNISLKNTMLYHMTYTSCTICMRYVLHRKWCDNCQVR